MTFDKDKLTRIFINFLHFRKSVQENNMAENIAIDILADPENPEPTNETMETSFITETNESRY